MNPQRRFLYAGLSVLLLILAVSFSGKIFEDVDATELVCVQDAWDGELHWYTQAGVIQQWFGKVTTYKKRSNCEFIDENGIPVVFNDGGHGTISLSASVDLPLDEKNLTQLHIKFGSQEAIENNLIKVTLRKSIYMSGPLMSSKESYAEKKNDLTFFIEDQASKGVYKTRQFSHKIEDPITGQEKTVTEVEIVKTSAGVPARQEKSPLMEYGVNMGFLSITGIAYDEAVKKQIKQQQNITMQVQTS